MTQYDRIATQYGDEMSKQFYKLLECKLVERALVPELAKRCAPKLLEFAAGTGYYTSRLLSWKPDATLTSMDISQAMLDINAAQNAAAISAGRLRVLSADGSQPQSYAPADDDRSSSSSSGSDEDGPYFDGAIGAWILNYADSRAVLRRMFDNIALNIKPGGFFVGVVPYPTEDLVVRGRACKEQPLRDIHPFLEFTRPLDDDSGWWFRVHLDQVLILECVHHRKSVYEEVAEEAGFTEIEWFPAKLPREDFVPPGTMPKHDLSPEVYRAFTDVGIFSVVRFYKK
ncbi:hypothetical protein BM221_005041 [Beauveria bassiana]|uniref:Methyltransferase domain-containing protein n=1 Tax=Beauveria bassiana TaxID=176275 RepID=A0A2N6NMF8_BEABA|nr:hypothetical protein BM221_005041 [Beauveria bassiana]